MDRAWFEYKGVNSIDMYMHIENDISFPSPEADVEFVEVLGRDGEVAIDNNRLKSVNFSIPIRLKPPRSKDINQVATEISNWLKEEIGWFPLRFSGSPDYEYIAIQYEQFDIQETLKQYGKTVITFKLKPYKRKINTEIIEVSNGMSITNQESKSSKPLIRIYGTGDITIKNNDKDWIRLKAVDEQITIDSELMTVYRDTRPQYEKMIDLGAFPILNTGNNVISWTGNVTRMELEPRWVAIT